MSVIRSRTKVLSSVFGSEASVRIPEKDFERLMNMAQTAGTLAKLNEAYDKDLGKMQAVIDKLTGRIKTLTERVAEYDNFMKIKGLVEEFKEFIRPKSIAEKLQKNKQVVEMREPDKVKKRSVEKRQDVAI